MRKNSGVIAQHSALCWVEAMTTILSFYLSIAIVLAGAIAGGAAVGTNLPHRFPDSTSSRIAVRLERLRQELSKLGWIEGFCF